eukprot:scaffold233_cov174-Ochromonas_danica.AAC.9
MDRRDKDLVEGEGKDLLGRDVFVHFLQQRFAHTSVLSYFCTFPPQSKMPCSGRRGKVAVKVDFSTLLSQNKLDFRPACRTGVTDL